VSGANGEPSSTDAETDYRASPIGRRRSWYGLKKHAKRVLSWRIPNALMQLVLRVRPDLRRTGRLPAPAHVKEVEGSVLDARFVMLRPDRCVVAKELYWGHGRRPRPEDDFALRLFATIAKRSDVMIDVGAYTGIFTLVGAAVNPRLEAHAFEIVPEVFRALFDNCVRNGVLHRVTLHHVGVGEDGATMTLPVEASDSALPDFFSSRLHFENGVQVRIVSLDSVARLIPSGARVAMKVDVEGTENEVFANGQSFLASFRPDILCEVLHGVADAPALEALLAPHGYHRYLIREADLLPSRDIEPNVRFRDWLFTTRAPQDLAELGIAVATTDG
jgi:FkbM family methyltransferase